MRQRPTLYHSPNGTLPITFGRMLSAPTVRGKADRTSFYHSVPIAGRATDSRPLQRVCKIGSIFHSCNCPLSASCHLQNRKSLEKINGFLMSNLLAFIVHICYILCGITKPKKETWIMKKFFACVLAGAANQHSAGQYTSKKFLHDSCLLFWFGNST